MLNSEEPWAAVRAPVAQDQPAKAAAVQATAQAVQSPGPKIKQRKFANGDRYVGGWQNGLPEGEGKYEWSDGSSYEGGWKAGAKHGVGRYIWNSGASYQGGWQDGCMHGVGAFEAPDGSRYQGGWKEDLKHGLGRKIYANGDAYEGLWAQGKPDGPGRYIWVDFNEYDGEWRAGRMSGQGTFVWKTGERYDGEWKDGQENGVGVFTFRDGSTYSGFWRSGKKHGVGIYRPAYSSKSGNSASDSKSAKEAALSSGGSRAAFADAAAAAAALPDEAAAEFMHRSTANGQAVAGLAAGKAPAAQAGMSRQQSGERMQQQGQPQQPAQQTQQQQQPSSDIVLVKEYKEGKLVRQFPLSNSTLAQIFTAFNGPAAAAARTSSAGTGAAAGSSSRHLSVTPLGEVLYEDRSAYELQQQLQLGIRWSVAGKALNEDPTSNESADLLPDDFIATSKQEFPRSGSKITSVHPSDDFIWKDYAPSVFRYLRMLAGLHPGDYIASLCSDQSLRLLASPGGRSGAMFYITADERYVVKTVTRAEAKLLMKLLPQYMQHMVQQPGTLITKFYGLHRVEPVHGRGKKVRFVVMGNVMCSGLPIHKRFELKGSTAGRSTPAEAVEADSSLVLKDLDLHQCIKLQGGIGGRLKAQLMADTSFLAANGLMDYSMLLGVHYKDHQQQQQQQQHDCRNLGLHDPDAGLDTVVSQFEQHLNSMQLDQRLAAALVELAKARLLAGDVHAAHNPKLALQMRCPVMALATRPLRNPSSSISRPLPPGPDQQQGASVLGQHMLATAVPLNAKQALTTGDTDDLHSQPQAHPVVLYFGITDLLQSYTLPKKLESAAKRLTAPAASISAVAPGYYAKRFRKFMAQVFV